MREFCAHCDNCAAAHNFHCTVVMGGRGAVACAVALWAGMLLGCRAGPGACLAWLALALVWIALGLRAPNRTGTVCLVLACFSVGVARAGAFEHRLEAVRARLPPLTRAAWVDVQVVTPPTRSTDESAATVCVRASAASLLPGTRLRVRLPPGSMLEWGDRARCLIEADVPPPVRNPGALDARRAAGAEDVAGIGRVLAALPLPSPWLVRWPQWTFMRLRRAIERVLARALDADAQMLVMPLVTGDRSRLPPERAAELRAAGLVHLLALSGLHVSFMAAVASAICASLGGGPRARGVARATCGLGYLGLAGPLPSLLRAGVSEVLGGAARVAGRALDPAQGLAVTTLLLLGSSPGLAWDLGFQFSCAATLGLVSVGPRLRAGLPRALRWLAPAAAAQAASAPVLLARMHVLTWLGAIANVFAVPLAALLLAAAWLGALAELLAPGAGRLPFAACELLSAWLARFCKWAAGVPHAVWPAGHEAGIAVVAAIGGALLLVALGTRDTLRARRLPFGTLRTGLVMVGGVMAALAWCLVLTVAPTRPPPGRWWLVALDVGQGDATALGFADGWWLVDAGGRTPHRDEGEAAVLPFLRWAGVSRLEGLVLTHDDGDHTGGAPAVIRGECVVRTLAAPPLADAPGPGARFHAGVVARADTLHVSPPLAALWPPRTDAAEPGWSVRQSLTSPDNAAGVVLEAGEGASRALLLADVDSLIEARIAARVPVAVLKVGHHGSGSSSGARFLLRCDPGAAVISVGAHNHFGHPAPGVLERLALTHARILRTDRDGAVWLEASDTGVAPVAWREPLHIPPAPAIARPSPQP